MQIKHYSLFNSASKTLNWESLRDDASEDAYFLPYTREAYLKKVDVVQPSQNTQQVIDACKELLLKKIFSIGSGIAAQEYQLKKFSSLPVIVSDYTGSIHRLGEFAVFDDAIQLDAFKDTFPVDQDTLVLFPRIDTEFENDQLEVIFRKCFEANVRYIWFIPAELLTTRIIAAEIKIALLSLFRQKPRVFCGYARSKSAFEKIWGKYYQIVRTIDNGKTTYLLKSLR